MEIRGSAAVVTGSTGGLGRRICLKLAQAGAHVTLVYLKSAAEAEQLAAELTALGPRAVAVQADITTQEGIDRMLSRARDAFGRVDILINDAAYNRWIPYPDLQSLDAETWRYFLDYNLTAPFLAMRSVAPGMKQQGAGRIVNVTSVAGLAPVGSSIAYATTKAGLIHLTRCMAVALAPEVLVNSVAPGLMEGTRMTSNLAPDYVERARGATALKRAADKDDVAEAVLAFVRTDSITGQTLVVDAGRIYH
jgi:3-oxoacyl-[acyl-carrier protein] reductase